MSGVAVGVLAGVGVWLGDVAGVPVGDSVGLCVEGPPAGLVPVDVCTFPVRVVAGTGRTTM